MNYEEQYKRYSDQKLINNLDVSGILQLYSNLSELIVMDSYNSLITIQFD